MINHKIQINEKNKIKHKARGKCYFVIITQLQLGWN
jgi:hypothetical protein